jgi:hypothetical protein
MDDNKLLLVLDFINNNDFALVNSPEYLPENIGFQEYLSIIEYSEQMEYIDNPDNNHIYELTVVGLNNLVVLKASKEDLERSAKLTHKKLKNESKMSTWKLWIFWPAFIFGIFGGIYSGIDLLKEINAKSQEKNQKKSENDVISNEKKSFESNRKVLDSLRLNKTEKDTLN